MHTYNVDNAPSLHMKTVCVRQQQNCTRISVCLQDTVCLFALLFSLKEVLLTMSDYLNSVACCPFGTICHNHATLPNISIYFGGYNIIRASRTDGQIYKTVFLRADIKVSLCFSTFFWQLVQYEQYCKV